MPTNDADELDLLKAAFSRVFAVAKPRPFGSSHGRHQGFSDDASGVQWNTGIDRGRGVTLGVNLEGMKYDGWPIARFIERELANPRMVKVITQLSDPRILELWWSRDAWQAAARPPIREASIGPEPPVILSQLDEKLWRGMLLIAHTCLDETRGHRGRATQTVTLANDQLREMQVSPHLQIKILMGDSLPVRFEDGVAAIQRARGHLAALHEFVGTRSA